MELTLIRVKHTRYLTDTGPGRGQARGCDELMLVPAAALPLPTASGGLACT